MTVKQKVEYLLKQIENQEKVMPTYDWAGFMALTVVKGCVKGLFSKELKGEGKWEKQ